MPFETLFRMKPLTIALLLLVAVQAGATEEPSAKKMRHYSRQLDLLEKTFYADQQKDDQFGNHFWQESKRVAASEGPKIIFAIMVRGRKWTGEEGLIFVPLVSLLPRDAALATLHELEHSHRESDRTWAREFLTEFEASDTKAAVLRYSK
jgi:hypothetical protein